jgi:cold shock CspA family protein/ribosome-associated translation inhibitor RaiA
VSAGVDDNKRFKEVRGVNMQVPLQITFRGIPPSDAVEARIRKKMGKLEKLYDRIMACRVMVETPHRRHAHGKLYHVRIDLAVPGGVLVINREPHERHAHEDVYVAIRDAFSAMQRKLQEHLARYQEAAKPREGPPHAVVARLFDDYGFLETADGREVFFHRNSVVNGGFHRLALGAEVRFAEVEGEKGPQASTVAPVGKEGRHLV